MLFELLFNILMRSKYSSILNVALKFSEYAFKVAVMSLTKSNEIMKFLTDLTELLGNSENLWELPLEVLSSIVRIFCIMP